MEFLLKYNEEPKLKSMDLVLFTDAVKHLMRIARILGVSNAFRRLVTINAPIQFCSTLAL
jgi:hypothetical protein